MPIGVTPMATDTFSAMRIDVHAEFMIHSGEGLFTSLDGSQ